MHPRVIQVPPTGPLSKRATRAPRRRAIRTPAQPPMPQPITATSYRSRTATASASLFDGPARLDPCGRRQIQQQWHLDEESSGPHVRVGKRWPSGGAFSTCVGDLSDQQRSPHCADDAPAHGASWSPAGAQAPAQPFHTRSNQILQEARAGPPPRRRGSPTTAPRPGPLDRYLEDRVQHRRGEQRHPDQCEDPSHDRLLFRIDTPPCARSASSASWRARKEIAGNHVEGGDTR
jgi:hypothetical protein